MRKKANVLITNASCTGWTREDNSLRRVGCYVRLAGGMQTWQMINDRPRGPLEDTRIAEPQSVAPTKGLSGQRISTWIVQLLQRCKSDNIDIVL